MIGLLVACGPVVDEGGDSATSQGEGSGGLDASSGSSGDDPASGTSGAESGTTTGALMGCTVLPDEAGELVTIILRNLTERPILVGRDTGCDFEPFDLVDPFGQFLAWHRGSCTNTCESISKGECIYCGSCGGSTFLRLEPGAEFSVEWAQTRMQTVDIPADCTDACEPSCSRPEMVEVGEYGFTSYVREVCEDESCLCAAGETACTVMLEEVELAEPESTSVISVLPSTTAVEIVFE